MRRSGKMSWVMSTFRAPVSCPQHVHSRYLRCSWGAETWLPRPQPFISHKICWYRAPNQGVPDVSLRRAASVRTLVFPSLQSQASSSSASPSSSSWKPGFFSFIMSNPPPQPTQQTSFPSPSLPSSHYVWFLTSQPVKHLAQLVEAPAIFFDPEAGRESASFCQLGRTMRWHHLSTIFFFLAVESPQLW